jgi:hypothetical protein
LAILIGFSIMSLMYIERIVKHINSFIPRRSAETGTGDAGAPAAEVEKPPEPEVEEDLLQRAIGEEQQPSM